MLVALQVTATLLLWFLNPITQSQTDTFALYLSVDLVSFAMLSYQYRVSKQGGQPSQPWLVVGYLSLIVLLSSNLLVV
jgi:hypothetical protein